MVEADPKEGLDAEDLLRIYDSGMASVDEHFHMLIEILATTPAKKKVKEPAGADEKGEAEKGEAEKDAAAPAAAPKKEKGVEAMDKGKAAPVPESKGEGEEESDDDDDDDDDSSVELVECDDEDELTDVINLLGLQPVAVTEHGDLRLPNGSVATAREYAYIFRQRHRPATDLMPMMGANWPGGVTSKQPTALVPIGGGGSLMAAGGVPSHARWVDKKVVAYHRDRQYGELKIAFTNNLMQTKMKKKIRAGRGDMSGGR